MADSDSDLLGRFVEQHDQVAFTELVQRHVPMVLGVCRRVLEDHHQAEDAAQASFLVLAERAARLDRQRPLTPWLFGVAHNLARTALRNRRRRERVQREVAAMPPSQPRTEDISGEIDAALAALPERERSAITLFHLEGRPVAEVAKLVGQPVGTVYSWLSRGRERLRRHLLSKGVAVSASLLLTALGGLNAAEVPVGFAAATATAASGFLASSGAATPAAALASQGIKTMAIIHSIKATLIAASLVATVGAAGWIAAAEGGGAKKKPASAILGAPGYAPTPEHPIGWRGDGTGRYPGATPPTSWERTKSGAGYATKGIVWMTPLPNISVSSPILVGERIFLTSENTDLVCIDRQSGHILWIRSNPESEGLTDEERKADPGYEKIAALLPQLTKANADVVEALNAQQDNSGTAAAHPPAALAKKQEIEKQIWSQQLAIYKKDGYQRYGTQGVFGYSGPTPTSDGKHVCVYYSTGVVVAYDLEGNRTWIHQKIIGGNEHGNFCSPIIGDNRFVVWAQEMHGYDIDTGKQAWTVSAKAGTYGSLFRLQAGNDLVAGFASGWFVRIRDGQLIWGDAGFGTGMTTPIVEGNMVLGYSDQNNRGSRTFKIPASTESGKVELITALKSDWTDGELSEKNFARTLVASSLFVDGLIYSLTEGGGLLVNNATTGDVVYRKVLPMKPHTQYWDWAGVSACPTLAGKYIYLMDNQGTTVVVQPGPQYKEVAVNRIEESRDGKDQVQNLTTPIFDGTRMYYRSPGFLYCIGEK